MHEFTLKKRIHFFSCLFHQAEARAEFAERSVQKLQKEVDRLEGIYVCFCVLFIKFIFSKKATKIEKHLHCRFDTYLVNVKSTVKIWSIFVAFLENMNFNNDF